jgi:hypothetical protein
MLVLNKEGPGGVAQHPEARTMKDSFMIETSVQERARFRRGVELFAECGAEVRRLAGGYFSVPSASDPDVHYVVDLRTGECECEDYGRHGRHTGALCKHCYCARVYVAVFRTRREEWRIRRSCSRRDNPLWGAGDLAGLERAAEKLAVA